MNLEAKGTQQESPNIVFRLPGESEPIIKIEKGKFYWKGEEVEDKHQVYERFNEWLVDILKKC